MRAIVTGELFSVLLRQRGLLALHGSCVARDGEAIGFIGHSGWGKSTLASFFVQQGYSLLNDDVIAIDFSGPFPVVVPGYAQVKLQPDAGERFLQNFDLLPEAHTETDKRVFCHDERFQRQPARLRKIYVLEGEIRPVQRLVPLPRQHAFLELVRHTRGNRLLKSEHFRQLHLEQCTTLLRQVSVSLLHRMRSFDLLPELYGLIEEDLHQLQS